MMMTMSIMTINHYDGIFHYYQYYYDLIEADVMFDHHHHFVDHNWQENFVLNLIDSEDYYFPPFKQKKKINIKCKQREREKNKKY